jgi:hypothetical protein
VVGATTTTATITAGATTATTATTGVAGAASRWASSFTVAGPDVGHVAVGGVR